MALGVSTFYNACELVLSPSPASDEALAAIGLPAERVLRWDRGVDTERFHPSLREEALLDGDAINVLYAGRITREKGAELLADAFTEARLREPRLHLVLAGGGPEQERLRERVGEEHTTFLGWLQGAELARAYASADIFLFPSATDTFGQVILEAQASGLPVLAVAEGGPLTLIEDRVSGLLREPDVGQLSEALLELATSPLLRQRLAASALAAVRARTWEQAMGRLAEGYRRALGAHERRPGRARGVGPPPRRTTTDPRVPTRESRSNPTRPLPPVNTDGRTPRPTRSSRSRGSRGRYPFPVNTDGPNAPTFAFAA
jgi:glycosyltransferase involved in cell wall biosynthesis